MRNAGDLLTSKSQGRANSRASFEVPEKIKGMALEKQFGQKAALRLFTSHPCFSWRPVRLPSNGWRRVFP